MDAALSRVQESEERPMKTQDTQVTSRDLRVVIASERAAAEAPRYLPVVGYYDNGEPTQELPAFTGSN